MTERLYYHDSFLYEFDAEVRAPLSDGTRPAIVLDRTAFYPTSGGQVYDTGWLEAANKRLRVVEVAERDDGLIAHYFEGAEQFTPGTRSPRFD